MKISVIFAGVLVAVLSGQAFAFHPLITEDTVLLGRDVRQVTGGLEHTISEEGIDRYSTGATAKFSYGFWNKFNLMLTIPWEGWSSKGLSESGLGDAQIEAKFQAGEKAGWILALKPGFSLPAGDEAKSLGAGKGGVWVYGIAGRAPGPWQFYLNAGYMLNRNSSDQRENIFKASAAAALKVLPGALLTAELAAASNTDKNSPSHPVTSGFGLVWSPYPTLDLDAGVKFGLNKPSASMGLLAGITLRL